MRHGPPLCGYAAESLRKPLWGLDLAEQGEGMSAAPLATLQHDLTGVPGWKRKLMGEEKNAFKWEVGEHGDPQSEKSEFKSRCCYLQCNSATATVLHQVSSGKQ